MTGCEVFEKAIISFGVDAALEYFATPKDYYYLFDELRKKESGISASNEKQEGYKPGNNWALCEDDKKWHEIRIIDGEYFIDGVRYLRSK